MKQAEFSLIKYQFTNVELNLENLNEKNDLALELKPKGTFFSDKSDYELIFDFAASTFRNDEKNEVVHVVCKAKFHFNNVYAFSDIPEYFYANSIAIMFPYVRAFISTVTLQANITPIILPTLNLSALRDSLKTNTFVK